MASRGPAGWSDFGTVGCVDWQGTSWRNRGHARKIELCATNSVVYLLSLKKFTWREKPATRSAGLVAFSSKNIYIKIKQKNEDIGKDNHSRVRAFHKHASCQFHYSN